MTRPFSLRAKPSLIAAIDARAARLGQHRTEYILSLVERDLQGEKATRKHRFASEDLIGSFSSRFSIMVVGRALRARPTTIMKNC